MATSFKASINNNPLNTKLAVTSILSINEMNYQQRISHHETVIPNSLIKAVFGSKNDNKEINASESKLTLIAALRNALINKDTDSFLFCLEQTDKVLIENTVKGLDENTIKMFIEKLIDLFQRSMIYKLNINPWMSQIIKDHYFIILSMSTDVIQNLNTIKALIDNYTKNYSKLIQLKNKLDCINSQRIQIEGSLNVNSKGKTEPLLIYEESEDEEEKEKSKKKKEVLSRNCIELYNEDEDNKNLDNQMDINYDNIDGEDDYFDIEDEDEDENYANGKQKRAEKGKGKEDENEEDDDDMDSDS